MTQEERCKVLIEYLIKDMGISTIEVPKDYKEMKVLLRSLMNIRDPKKIDASIVEIQDAYLQEEIRRKGITDVDDLTPVCDNFYVWKGDITTLRCDAIVNACNNQLLGCFIPNHSCIDNAIHTYSGMQLRYKCYEIISKQRYLEPVGKAKITSAYNLPSKYILHTVGPMIKNGVTKKEEWLLSMCYKSCLELADAYHLESIAFNCISTGVFRFPNDKACAIAIHTVKDYLKNKKDSHIKKVIFNVFKEEDEQLYTRFLTK